MIKIDNAILTIDDVICKNIEMCSSDNRGFISQNILSQLRNFVEYVAQKVVNKDADPNDYDDKRKALERLKIKGQYSYIYKFHKLLQMSVSHYTFEESGSERLMLKYYEFLLRIRDLLQESYGLAVLQNLETFPLKTESNFEDYYREISLKLDSQDCNTKELILTERVYVKKIKPFFQNNNVYYEVTYTLAHDNNTKFDRVIAFCKQEISAYYSARFKIREEYISLLGEKILIQIIEDWNVDIRPCEIRDLLMVCGITNQVYSRSQELKLLMEFLTTSKISLVDLVVSSDELYTWVKDKCLKKTRKSCFFSCLDRIRDTIKNEDSGCNILRYFLHNLSHRVMKQQYNQKACDYLSGYNLQWGCIPFDDMPFATALIGHNPSIIDLLECISSENREHEFLAHFVKTNTEQKNILFTNVQSLTHRNIDELIKKYNETLYCKHAMRQLCLFKKHIYIRGYVEDTVEIIRYLKGYSNTGFPNYAEFIEAWFRENTAYNIDCKEKFDIIKSIFLNSRVAFIYGAAGTGKTTLINHISYIFNNERKIYLANTNPAVENLKRKVNSANSKFRTIASFLNRVDESDSYDILIVDESSTVSNKDMKKLLENSNFRLLIFVGDIFQIESILYGNWFSISKAMINSNAIFELQASYRTKDKNLLDLWSRVREKGDSILEPMVRHEYTSNLNHTIFKYSNKDEIILTLNYDGVYGINNINHFLQSANPNVEVSWGTNIYKIGDPILFNEVNRFAPLLFNNLKGRIITIQAFDSCIYFEIEIEKNLTEYDVSDYELDLEGFSENGYPIVSFFVNKFKSSEEQEDDSLDCLVPFQVAYAISIHKAQGLEFDSVKIVIANEVGEQITHNIFYTAITRAKETLKIYWSPETEKSVLDSFKTRDNTIINKTVGLLRAYASDL